ncbi:hypothetical protein SAMN04488691_10812 [Haloferax larsenii]|uniref:Uncharacterized protein n=2 Tax=Haloferax larsenii TaxID=302484 RepID=A0A1H7SZN0_HALLR|nr:hypothetical protein SAMN04488691_10812 [Haloferax larsenii]
MTICANHMKIDVVESLHQPEYTGENRCEPCTVLNLVIAGLLGSLVARKSKLGGLVAVGVSIGLIYLRGYLVPGTPTLTKQYLPPTVLEWFGKDPEPNLASGFGSTTTESASTAGSQATSNSESASPASPEEPSEPVVDERDETDSAQDAPGDDLEAFFMNHDILEPCADSDDLCLTDDFEDAWTDETEALVDTDLTAEKVADAFGIDESDQTFELITNDEARILKSETASLGQWPSRAALIADVAASRVLQSRILGWNEFAPEERGPILNSLRMFLETCPTTGGDIQLGEEVVESCCSSHKVIAVTCEDSGERLFEHPLPDSE